MPDRKRLSYAAHPRGDYGRTLLDEMNTGTHERLATWAFDEMFRRVGELVAGTHILDVGCGGGANLLRLRARAPHSHVTGVDYASTAVERSSATCAQEIAAGHCAVHQGDVSALPFSDASFDVVTAFETIYFWPSLTGGLSEIRRVMTPDSTLMICCETDDAPAVAKSWGLSAHSNELMHIYRTDEIEQSMRETGLVPSGHMRHPEMGWIAVFAHKSS